MRAVESRRMISLAKGKMLDRERFMEVGLRWKNNWRWCPMRYFIQPEDFHPVLKLEIQGGTGYGILLPGMG